MGDRTAERSINLTDNYRFKVSFPLSQPCVGSSSKAEEFLVITREREHFSYV